jgi:hypothetical protein
LAEGLAILSGVALLAAALSLLLDWQLELSRPVRFFCLGVFVVSIGWLAYRHLIRPLRMPLTALDVAAAIDRTAGPVHSRLATRVASVLELPGQAGQPDLVSPTLVARAVAESYQELESVPFQKHLNRKHFWLSTAAVAACLLVPAAFAIGAPSVARLWRDRWLLGSNRPWPHSTRIEVANLREGRLIVPRGEPAPLQVHVVDSEKETEAVWMRMTFADGNEQTVTLNRFAAGDFRFDLPPFQETVQVEMWGGDGTAEPFQIDPRDRPKITSLKLTAKHPRDPAPQTFAFAGDEGNIRLLAKTDAQLEFETNVPVEEVRVDADANSPGQFDRITDQKFNAKWVHKGQVRMRVSLIAKDSDLESFPRPITIGDKPDRPPTISMRHSGVRLRVTPNATIPLSLTVRDDYGIRDASLLAAIDQRGLSLPAEETEDEPADQEKKPDAGDAPATEGETPAASETPATPETTEPAKPADEPGTPESSETPPAATDDSAAALPRKVSLQFTALLAEGDAPASADAAEGVFDDEAGDASEPDSEGAIEKVLPTQLSSSFYGPVEPALETIVEQQQSVELSQMTVKPGESLVITATAEDDCFTGRQSTTSRKLIFKIVKDDELFKEILLRQQQLRARLQKSYEQMIELRDTLKTADAQADASSLLRTFLLIRREIGAVTRDLEASVLEMRLNKLGGQESWDLIEQTVLQPLTRLQEQELERQKQSLETLVGSQPDPIEEVIERQQAIVDALKKVLYNMSQWDSFIDIINQVNSIIKIQEAARKMTEELKAKQVESIFD